MRRPAGLKVAELESAIELVFQRFTVTATAVTAYDPDHDPDAQILAAGRRVVSTIARASRRDICRHPIGAIRGET
jgi:arginase family enzyme